MTGERQAENRMPAAPPRLVAVPRTAATAERERVVWFDARGIADREDPGLVAALNSGIETLLALPERLHELAAVASHVRLVAFVEHGAALDGLPADCAVASPHEEVLAAAATRGRKTALTTTIGDAESLARAIALGPRFDHLIVRLLEPTNIPLELVIARLRGRGTALMKEVATNEEAALAFETLEAGSDGVLLSTQDVQQITRLQADRRRRERGQLKLVSASVVRTQYIGMGHRACVDTVSMMTPREGFVVGSTSSGGLLACSETHPLPYMNLRPFRVNAGAVHSYIWGPDDMVEYLSDLRVGSRVLCVGTNGETRTVSIGRIKIEVRPLMLVEARHEDGTLNAIVQDDWHIRLFREDGEVASVTALKPGDRLLAHVTEPGRHVGIFVKETIIER